MHQQHADSVELRERWIRQQSRPRHALEAGAQQEIPIAMHDEAGHAGGGEFSKAGTDSPLMRIEMVVADPELEQVTEDVQRAGPACRSS